MRRSWIGTEAIAIQSRDKLAKPLAEAIEYIRNNGKNDAAVPGSKLNELIRDATGFKVKVRIVGDAKTAPNAFVLTPTLDSNHIFTVQHDHARDSLSNWESILRKSGIETTIDRQDGRVYGDFTKIDIDMVLTSSLFDICSNSEIAAIVLHEIGHLWGTCERLADSVIANYAIQSAAAEIMGLESKAEKIKLLNATAERIRLNDIPTEDIVKTTDKNVMITHIVVHYLKERRTEEGHRFYSARACEYSADQFATRHGVGKELVSALYKLNGGNDKAREAGRMRFLMSIIGKIFKGALVATLVATFAMLAMPIAFPLTIYTVFLYFAHFDDEPTYDRAGDRYRRICNDMKFELKNPNLCKERRQELLTDLAFVENLISEVGKSKGLAIKVAFDYMVSSRRNAYRHEAFQQQLEGLVHNDLFVASAKFA